MNESWSFVIDFLLISLLIGIATVLKARIPFFKKWIVPTSMIAGFLGLLLGPEFLGWLKFDIDMLGELVYHLMGIGFIALSLKERQVNRKPAMLNSGMIIVSTYLIQGIIGFSFFLFLVHFFYPQFFPGIGLLLPLGFGQGPGQAYSIGTQWEELGAIGGGNIGLTIAGIGFLWATIIGIIVMNLLIRKKKFTFHPKQQTAHEDIVETSAPDEIPLADAIDKLTYQVALIGIIYFITYLTLHGLEIILTPLGTFGSTLAQLLIGFHFIIGSIYAMIFRTLLNKLKRREFKLEHEPNNFLLQRISGFAFDYMITASIAAISIYALQDYLLPIIVLTSLGGLVTIFFLVWVVPRLFPTDTLPNTLGFFGMATGTISTGLALVKAVDPEFQSNTTDNLVVGSATAIMFGFPLLLLLNIPIVGFIENNPMLYLYTLGGLILYFFVLMTVLHFRSKKIND
ncbi:sodium/glutamate symporter family protein [Oceanobacillus halotolerans]|uniref:S-layer homology domain-containing protein n=1 Tax=Oceanobacillus halotolerans TaxID=2663380 RepID=UPI0013DA9573|nr:S-layer homology domain-containing protein [Oceanobacillus halotolerans]